MGWAGWLGLRFVLGHLPVTLLSSLLSLQLLSLNLSNNRLYKLDDMSSIVQKAPNLKILNLSGNEVRIGSWVEGEDLVPAMEGNQGELRAEAPVLPS